MYTCSLYDCQALADLSDHYTARIDSIPSDTPAIQTFKLIDEILSDADSVCEEWGSEKYIVSYEVEETVNFCLDEIIDEEYNIGV